MTQPFGPKLKAVATLRLYATGTYFFVTPPGSYLPCGGYRRQAPGLSSCVFIFLDDLNISIFFHPKVPIDFSKLSKI